MERTAIGAVMVAVSLLWSATAAGESAVYWTAAHELAPQVQPLPGMLTWGDLDRDGDDDLSSTFAQLWRDGACPGAPVWRSEPRALPYCSGCTYTQVALGDLDSDGDLDVVYGCFEPYLHLFWNVGTPQSPRWQEDSSSVQGMGGYYSSPFLADLDDDGDLDMLMVTTSAAVGSYENVGTSQAPAWTWRGFIPEMVLGASSPRAVLADLDGDGDLDVVGAASSTSIRSWENIGTPQQWQFVRNQAMLTGVDQTSAGWYVLALPDVDCDGDPDLLLKRASDGARFLFVNESVTSTAPMSWGAIKAIYH